MSTDVEAAVPEPQVTPEPQKAPVRRRKRPLLASFLSFLAPGIGQYYNDQWIKALIIIISYFGLCIISAYYILQIIGMFLVPFLIIVWLYAIVDAFLVARKINRMVAA
jgi:TM2 domain-containing membrane protein YozV